MRKAYDPEYMALSEEITKLKKENLRLGQALIEAKMNILDLKEKEGSFW